MKKLLIAIILAELVVGTYFLLQKRPDCGLTYTNGECANAESLNVSFTVRGLEVKDSDEQNTTNPQQTANSEILKCETCGAKVE